MTALAYQDFSGTMVPRAQYDQACRERDDNAAKLSAVAMILQDASLSWKQKCLRSSVALAIEAQRPKDDPNAHFIVDTGQLAKRAGLIPPTPEGDQKALQSAWKSGRKLAGEALREMADAGAFDDYTHLEERDQKDRIVAERVALQITRPHIEVIRAAARLGGERKLQKPRGRNVPAPRCPNCGNDHMHLKCVDCGWTGTGVEWAEEMSAKGGADDGPARGSAPLSKDWQPADRPAAVATGTAFQTLESGLETLRTENARDAVSDAAFQTLESGEVLPAEAPIAITTCAMEPPQDLRVLPQWVDWRYEEREGKLTKVPQCPSTGHNAKCTDPRTWGPYVQAIAARDGRKDDGIGFVFTAGDLLAGVDFDNCIDDEGRVDPVVWAEVLRLNTYTELSPSRRGLKCIGEAILRPGGNVGRLAGHKVEMYDHGRYFTFTGQHVMGTPATIQPFQDALLALQSRACPPPLKPTPLPRRVAVVDSSDANLIARACDKSPRFEQLWRGDTSAYNCDDSRADMALCRRLEFWTGGDALRMDRLFRQSNLMREKWDERRGPMTYGELTIGRVLSTGGSRHWSRS